MGYQQGTYEVRNKDKYVGTKNPRYLSSYELKVFRHLDNHKAILEWGAETVVVPYFKPGNEGKKMSRYMVDVYVKYKNREGHIINELIEIKPSKDRKKPRKTKGKSNKSYQYEVMTYAVNQAKWAAAEKFAEERGMRFRVIDEGDIFF